MLITGGKKKKRDNIDTREKELLKNYEKKERENCMITLMIKENRLDTMIKTGKRSKRVEIKDERKQVFDNVHGCSMVGPFILTTPAFKIIEEDFESAIQEGPTYICDLCWKFEFRKNVIKLNALKYQTGICNKFSTGKSD